MTEKQQLYKTIEKDICDNNAFMVYLGACCNGVDYGTDRYSEAIKRLCELDKDFHQVTSDLTKRFYSGDLGEYNGDTYEQELKQYGKETGHYLTEWGYIDIKRDVYFTTIYFPFEK